MKSMKRILATVLVLAMVVTSGLDSWSANASNLSGENDKGVNNYLEIDTGNDDAEIADAGSDSDTTADADSNAAGDVDGSIEENTANTDENAMKIETENDTNGDTTGETSINQNEESNAETDTNTDSGNDSTVSSTENDNTDASLNVDNNTETESSTEEASDIETEENADVNVESTEGTVEDSTANTETEDANALSGNDTGNEAEETEEDLENFVLEEDMEISDLNLDTFDATTGVSTKNGLPARGWGIMRAADDPCTEAVKFVARVSNYYAANNTKYAIDLVRQIYTYDAAGGKWVAKADGKQVVEFADLPQCSGSYSLMAQKGADVDFTLAPGELCLVYPATKGTGNNPSPTTKLAYYSYNVAIGLESTEEYEVSTVDGLDDSFALTFPNLFTNWYAGSSVYGWQEKPSVKTITLQKQNRMNWATQENGLPNAGLQIKYDIDTDVEFTDYANMQFDVTGWTSKTSGTCALYYNGESNLGAKATTGYSTRAGILYRVDLYEKGSNGKYTKNRTLTDHMFCAAGDDSTKVLKSFQDKLKDAEVQNILKNGGVISIVPLSQANYTYNQMIGPNDLTDAQSAPVFGYDYFLTYAGKSDKYTVSVDNMDNSVSSQTDANGKGAILQQVTVKVSGNETAEQGLMIDGEGIPEGTTQHLYVQLDPKKGFNYEGNQALRFLARVYVKKADGTYTAKPLNYDTHCSNWDYVQRDTSSANQAINYTTNFNWQDNRYIECDLASNEVLMIYPIVWDSAKSNWEWYPYSQYEYNDTNRYLKAFQEINKLNSNEWSFSYKIGVKDTFNTLLVGGTCENGTVSAKDGVLSSGKNVTNNTLQKVKLQLIIDGERLNSQGNPTLLSSVDGGLVLKFEGLSDVENLDYDAFRKNMIIYLKTTANGMNGARMDGVLREDAVYFNAVYYDVNGNWVSQKQYWYSTSGNTTSATNFIGCKKLQQFTLDDMTEADFNALKEGGSLCIYPVVRAVDSDSTYTANNVSNLMKARYYSFDYGFITRSDTTLFKIEEITDTASSGTTTTLSEDEIGIYNGAQTLSYNGVRKSDVTVKLAQNEDAVASSGLGFSENGLPNHGLRFVIDGSNIYGNMMLNLEVSAPKEKKNGETRLEDSHVDVMLLRYQKSGEKYYCAEKVTTAKLTATYPASTTYTGSISFDYFENGSKESVYVLLPVQNDNITNNGGNNDSNLVEEFGFNVKLTGLRTDEFGMKSIQKSTEDIDPLAEDTSWSAESQGNGPYKDRYDLGMLSSDGSKLLNLKINVGYRSTDEKAQQGLHNVNTPVNNGVDLNSSNMKNMVVIRNNAKGYTAKNGSASSVNNSLSADDLPDIQIAITASSQIGDNASSSWGYYSTTGTQLPYQAFLYNYSNGTYKKIQIPTTSNGYGTYYGFDNSDNPIAGSGTGPATRQWGAYPGQTSAFHTHLADDQAIIIVPTSNYYNFDYQVSIRNSDQYAVDTYKIVNSNGGEFTQKRENLYQSGTITNVNTGSSGDTSFQEVELTTAKVTAQQEEEADQNKTFQLLEKSLPAGQTMRKLGVTLFDYNFPELTATDFTDQPSKYKFLLDPLNNYDYNWNHIGDNKTLVYGGIIQDTLGSDNTPVFNYSIPFDIFGKDAVSSVTNGGTKAVYPSQFEFVYDEATSTYSYNSHLHHAQLEDDGVIRQYDKGLGLEDWGNQSAGFFPYNRWETSEGKWGSVKNNNADTFLMSQDDLNYHFGMSMLQEFTVPMDGKVKGNDMVFKISGDDDIWMFIDGKLVLDIGGIHEAIKGEINFTKGTYTINGETLQLSDILTGYSVEEFGKTTGEWAFGSQHTFEFFYLERGGTLSNMDISFNIPLYKETTLEKEVVSTYDTDKNAKYNFKVSLFADEKGKTPYTGLVYLLDEDGNRTKQTIGADGTFEVTINTEDGKGQVTFLTQEECVSYSVKELENDTYSSNKFAATWKTSTSTGTASVSEGSAVKTGTKLICTNTRTNGSLKVSKTVKGTAGNKNTKFHFTVTLGKKLTGTYGDMEFKKGVATFTLKHGESKTATNLPGNMSYTVTETEADKDGYVTTATGAEGTITDGQTMKAKFVNCKDEEEENPEYGKLKILKTLKSYNTTLGDVTFVFQVEAVDKNGKTVYSNVVSTTHNSAGTKEVVIENIPAGATVTVTEVYSGASYTLTSKPNKTVTIKANKTATVEFTNTYNDELVPGYGVTNHFEYNKKKGWEWSQLTDNSTANE